jgi:WD40 repeat protein
LSKKPVEVRLHNDEITDIVWDPSNESNFYTSAKDKSIKKWDINTKLSNPVTFGKSREENINLAISPDGK